jgi:hypothetical protein
MENMQMSEYAQKYRRLWGSSLSPDYPFPPTRLPASPEDYQRALNDQRIVAEQRDRDHLHNIAHNVLFEVLREPLRALQTPVPTIMKHTEKAKTLNISQLKNNEEDAKLEIELIDKAVGIIENQYLSAENAERVERGLHITITRGSGSESFNIRYGKDYEEFTALMREKAAVLKEVREHHGEVLKIYQAELEAHAKRRC